MIALLALIIRLVLLAIFTFGFVVLFEHGPKNYLEHAKTDAVVVKDWLEVKLGMGMKKSVAPAASTPDPTPQPTPQPSAIPSAPAPSATPGSTPTSTPVATPASTPMATPVATPMTTPAPVPPPMPSPTVAASPTTDGPKGAPSDWQSLQNQPIDDEVAPGSSQ